MKIIYIFLSLTLVTTFYSCKKCETCTPYKVKSGVMSTTADRDAQTIKLCDNVDIQSYESLVNFRDAATDTAKFICK